MLQELLITLTALIGNLFLSLFTLQKNPRSATNRLFFLFTITISGYLVFNFFLSQQTDNLAAFNWIKLIMTSALFINLLFYLFASTFPNTANSLSPRLSRIAILITLALIPITTTRALFENVWFENGQIQQQPGWGMPIFLLHTIVFLVGGIIVLLRKYKSAKNIEKAQLNLLVVGTIFMFLAIMITNVILVIFFNNANFIGFLPVYTLFFIACISYAIIKHRFLDITLIVARTVSYSLLTVLLLSIYGLLFYITSTILLGEDIHPNRLISSAALAVILVYTVQPLQQILEKYTDRVFYKGRYDSQQLLTQLSHIMASTIRLQDLTNKTVQLLIQQIKISHAGIILLEKKHIYFDNYIKNTHSATKLNFEQTQLLIGKRPRTLIFEELNETPTKTLMREVNVHVVIPLSTSDEQVGLLILGEKSSGEIYSEQDIKLFQILSSEFSLAIQNAKAFQQISNFNLTLKDEVKHATEDLRNANRRLKLLDRLKDEFVSIASHELRTPMTAIKSYLWMILNKSDPQDHISDKTKQYVERAYISTERLINLVNDMLDVSRIEAGQVQLKLIHVNLGRLAQEVMHEVTARAVERQITVTLDNQTNQTVMADPDKVHQVLINLVGNALKFTPPQGKVAITILKKDAYIHVHVSDTGQGIAKQDLEKLFSKFGRLENSYVSMAESGGTGLGLYISKQLINLHHGRIWADSQVGQGSTFSFSLPIDKDTRQS